MLAQDYFKLRLVRLKPAEDWSFKRDGICVLLPKGGAGNYVTASGAHRLVSGDVLVVNNSATGQLSVADRGDLTFWCFSLPLHQLYPLFACGEIALLETVSASFNVPKLFPAALPLAKQCHRLVEDIPPQFNLDHRSQLLRVASVILMEEFQTARDRQLGTMGVEAHLVQVFEQISAEELLTISVGDLAVKFNCSRRHLNRLFHQYFGFSVAALRMEMRLLKAVSILRDGNAKIINVAEQCGFNHLGLFNTCFKRRFGVSPGQWRKQVAKGDNLPNGDDAPDSVCPLHAKGMCPLTGGPARSLAGPSAAFLESIGRTAGNVPLPVLKGETKPRIVPARNGGNHQRPL